MAGSSPFSRASDGAPATSLVALPYFACAYALLATGDQGRLSAFCCADAVLLAALLLRPSAAWWRPIAGCMVAVLLANLLTHRPLVVSLAFAAGNMVTPVLAAAALRAMAGDEAARIDTPRSIARLAVLAGVVAPAIGAAIGAAIASEAFARPYATTWLEWFATNSAGMMLGTPLLLMLWTGELWSAWRGIGWQRLAIAGLLLAAVAGASLIAFRDGLAPLLFLPAVLVIVGAVRTGRVGAAASVLIVAVIGSAFAGAAGARPLLAAGDAHLQILFLQGYLAVVLLTALPVAASVEETRRLQRALIESEARYRGMAEHSGDLIAWVDRKGVCRYASPASRELIGIAPDEMVGIVGSRMIHPDDRVVVARHHARSLASAGEIDTLLYRSYHSDGRLLWMEAKTRAVFGGDVAGDGELLGVQWTIRDVTAHKSVEAMLSEAANSDSLTGLANRRAFFSLLDIGITRARGSGQPMALAIVDLDHFKHVNDMWGHDAGDEALRLTAKAVTKAIRGDDLFARIGGEEFGLLMPGIGMEDALAVCERVRATVAALDIPIADHVPIRITLSAGVALLEPDDDATSLVRAADRALYVAKRDGRDRVEIAGRAIEREPR